jgi:hypothetical protein
VKFSSNVILTQAGADWLDEQALNIRKTSRVSITRSAFLRAFVEAAQGAGLSFSRCRSEQEIAEGMLFFLKLGIDRCAAVKDGTGASGEQNGRQRP